MEAHARAQLTGLTTGQEPAPREPQHQHHQIIETGTEGPPTEEGGGDGLGALAASAAAAALIRQEILDDFWASLSELLNLFASAGN